MVRLSDCERNLPLPSCCYACEMREICFDDEWCPKRNWENDVDTLENRFVWWGASRLALWLADFLADTAKENQMLRKPKTLANILTFLAQNKADMLNFLNSSGSVGLKLAPIRNKKGKVTEYKPICLAWAGYSRRDRDEMEFISPQEYKYRDTAKILGDALNRAADMLALLTDKSKDELFISLIGGTECEIPSEFGKPVLERRKPKAQTVFVLSESEYEEKKRQYPEGMPLGIGFRVYKCE